MVSIEFPPFEKDILPVVLLGRCYGQNSEQIQTCARKLCGKWKRTLRLDFVYAYHANRDENGIDGTLGDVYLVGLEALRHGWKRFLIFDALTEMQFCGKSASAQNQVPSAVVVSLKSTNSDGILQGRNVPDFVITRTRWKIAFEIASEQVTSRCETVTPFPPTNHTWRVRYGAEVSDGVLGQMVLRDPEALPFNNSSGRRVSRRELCKLFSATRPPLPPEVTCEIAKYICNDTKALEDLTEFVKEGDGWMCDNLLPLICLARLTESQEAALRQQLQAVIDKWGMGTRSAFHPRATGIRFIRWLSDTPASLSDMMRIYDLAKKIPYPWEEYAYEDEDPDKNRLTLLLHELPSRLKSTQMITIDTRPGWPDVAMNVPWRRAMEQMHHRYYKWIWDGIMRPSWGKSPITRERNIREVPGTVEFMLGADHTFPPSQTSWRPVPIVPKMDFRLQVMTSRQESIAGFQTLGTFDYAHGSDNRSGESSAELPFNRSVIKMVELVQAPYKFKQPWDAFKYIGNEGSRVVVAEDDRRRAVIAGLTEDEKWFHARIPPQDAYDFAFQCGTWPYNSVTTWARKRGVTFSVYDRPNDDDGHPVAKRGPYEENEWIEKSWRLAEEP